jgi:hypothetical protein
LSPGLAPSRRGARRNRARSPATAPARRRGQSCLLFFLKFPFFPLPFFLKLVVLLTINT